MKPIYMSISQTGTGNKIKRLIKEKGFTVKDVQSVMGFENPQAIYKWMSGRSLPSLDNLVILSKILHMSMEDILVVDGDVVFLFKNDSNASNPRFSHRIPVGMPPGFPSRMT